MRPLDGRVAVVTGGGKNLGRAFALELARRGAKVVVNNRRSEVDDHGRGSADLVVEQIVAAGGEAVADYGDAGDPTTAETLVQRALDTWGRLDVVVANAAVKGAQMLHKTTEENFRHVSDVNVIGTTLLIASASRVMREAGHGRIVVIGSTAGLHGEPTVSAYASSKGAVIALARTAAAEGASRGVLTNAVLPYATSQMTSEGIEPQLAAVLTPEAVAPVVAALADPDSTVNGQVLVVAGDGLRTTDVVEHDTVRFDSDLGAAQLADLIDTSRAGGSRSFPHAHAGFLDLVTDLTEGLRS